MITRSEVNAIIERELRRVRREDGRATRLRQAVRPFVGHALDAKLDSMTTKEFAEAVLRKLGLLEQNDPMPEDPLSVIEAYVSARHDAAADAAGRRPERLAQDSGDSFLDRYLKP